MEERSSIKMEGFYKILDKDTREVIKDGNNAINFENMSIALANSLAHKPGGYIKEIVFGNGASTVDNLGIVNYLPPNVSGQHSTLYNETYSKIIDNNSPLNTDVASNRLDIVHKTGTFYTDIIVTITLDYGEPSGQLAFDDATNSASDSAFVFDEMGLRTYGGETISHAIFSPTQKALNRAFEIIYTVRIYVA